MLNADMNNFITLLIFLMAMTTQAAVDIQFPTENRALVEGKASDFFQPTISKREVSGTFGFVRTSGPEPPRYLERLHEGVDIKPVRRDANGEPLDPIVAVAAGKVVYVNQVASRSNYGKYIIIEHRFDGWPMYAFYAHMASVTAREGDMVTAGQPLGILGYTGSGINKQRAHLHFEMTFRHMENFDRWFNKVGKPTYQESGTNHHGDFSGLSFLGVDPAELLKASASGKAPTVPEIFAREQVQFKVRVPSGGRYLYFQKQFPFLTEGGIEGPPPVTWEILCNRIGIPLGFERVDTPVDSAELSWFRPNTSTQQWFTRGLVEGRGGKERLSKWGRKWISQLTWSEK
jgi:hypothetical protein